MRKIAILSSFFVLTPPLLLFSILYFLFLTYNQTNRNQFVFSSTSSPISFAALPGFENSLENSIEQKDIRIENTRQFLAQYHSPLEPYSDDIVSAADKYNIDFRLVPAIAMQESNLCAKIIKNSHNCWGFGIYGKKITLFDNYKDAIDTVSKTLARDYVQKGLTTPEEIMTKYTPSNTGTWAFAVDHFMDSLDFTL